MTESQDKLSLADKDWLAEFAGAKLRPRIEGLGSHRAEDEELYWKFPDGSMIPYEDDLRGCKTWNPLLPEHGWLILKALVEKQEESTDFEKWSSAWIKIGWAVELDGAEFLWPAVSVVALATRKDGVK